MKKYILLLLGMTLFSCGTYQSEITFYADGSGKTNIHYDLGKMIKEMKAAFEGFGKAMEQDSSAVLGNAQDSLSNEVIFPADSLASWWQDTTSIDYTQSSDEEENNAEEMWQDTTNYHYEFQQDSTQSMGDQPAFGAVAKKQSSVEKFFSNLDKGKVDTFVTIYNIIPDSVLKELENATLLKQVSIEFHLDSVAETGTIDLTYTYKNFTEARQIGENMAKAEFIETGDTTSYNSLKSNFSTIENLIFDPKAGVLSSREVDAFENGMVPKEFASMEGGNDEMNIDMVLQLMGLDKIEQIYHLPAKIKEVKGIDYELIDDDSVKLRFDMKQMIKTGKVPAYEIRF